MPAPTTHRHISPDTALHQIPRPPTISLKGHFWTEISR